MEESNDLWTLLRDAANRGISIRFGPGQVGAMRVELLQDNQVYAIEVLHTCPAEYSDVSEPLKRRVYGDRL